MTSLSARSVRLSDQVLAALDEEAPLRVSTAALLAKVGLSESDRAIVLRLLNRLAGRGEAKKIELEEMRCLY